MFTRVTRTAYRQNAVLTSVFTKSNSGVQSFIGAAKARSQFGISVIGGQSSLNTSWLRTAQTMSRSFATKKDDDDDPTAGKKSDIERFEEEKAKKRGNKPEVNEFWEENDVSNVAKTLAGDKKGSGEAAEASTTTSSASDEETVVKPRRKRRSKAEIEAEKL